jgi:hypothetical protein
MPQDASQTGQASTTREHDIETVRRFYGELLAFEERMAAVGDQMHNRGRWLEAQGHLWKARESLQMFIGERMTTDIEQQRLEAERQPSLFDESDEPEGGR